MNKKKLHIDIDEEIKFKLDELSKNRGMKTNELIRFILSEYLLKEGKKWNDTWRSQAKVKGVW